MGVWSISALFFFIYSSSHLLALHAFWLLWGLKERGAFYGGDERKGQRRLWNQIFVTTCLWLPQGRYLLLALARQNVLGPTKSVSSGSPLTCSLTPVVLPLLFPGPSDKPRPTFGPWRKRILVPCWRSIGIWDAINYTLIILTNTFLNF